MHKIRSYILVLTIIALFVPSIARAEEGNNGGTTYVSPEKYISNGYELSIYRLPDQEVPESILTLLQDLFFGSYPEMKDDFGTTTNTSVSFLLNKDLDEPGISTVAYTDESLTVHCSLRLLEEDEGYRNAIVHELFHVVQNGYPDIDKDPIIRVLSEGLADYAREKYGVYEEVDWVLPEYSSDQSYMDSYRVTAAFISWIADTYDEDFPVNLNKALHEGSYTDEFWVDATGLDIDQLWAEYGSAQN